MRIVAGKFRGRQLAAPAHDGLRPTADRVRQSIFNILAHGIDAFDITGMRVIDLFAGTGALGIEALSRGASYCLFIEESAEARALIRRNVEAFGLTGETKIFRRDACDLGAAGTMEPFGIAFLDPPYGREFTRPALAALASGGWLQDGAVIVAEERAGVEVSAPADYRELDARTWGETGVTFLRYQKP